MAPDASRYLSKIGAKTSLVGDISFQDDLIIEGAFQGKIKGGNVLHILQGSKVKADLFARHIVIGGTIVGKIIATESTEILVGSRVKGQIVTKVLRIEDGASFEGHCKTQEKLATEELPSSAKNPNSASTER